ncbi:quinone oxidoreductase family protein [Jiangella alkaliphila]|uniref:Zinc-binding dehydrogenase n=1 Tax=Jiangella alkaliphila TaxID=419479 RepID=A0A1H2LTR7_9ACTN|nr:zinc-binding dehydrogenase [Jiangella alkaliphila]SDU84115.1 Zinc-binding dehydrogenase [Jiangella alkaliphila]
MIPATMRAARHHRYGDPDVLRVDTVDVPRPGPREVLIRVHGASVNPSDALFRSGRLRVGPGDRVLIVGASGGVGSAAVQLGVAMGAAVTAVAGPGNAGLCRELGASDVLDHSAPLPRADLAFDAVADLHGAQARDYRRLLARGGRMATTATRAVPFALASALLPGPQIRVVQVKARRADLVELTRYADDGALRPVVHRRYPLDEIAAAHRAVETGHARGKRVIEVA